MEAVLMLLKFIVPVVIFLCLSTYSGALGTALLTFLGYLFTSIFVSLLFPLLVRLPPVSAVTPLLAEQFAWELRFQPDRQKVNFVLEGLPHGFHLGFSPSQKLKSAKQNMPSAPQHPSVVDQYLNNPWVGWQVHSVLLPSRIFMLAALGLFPNEASLGRGASSWTFPPRKGPVSTMGLIRTNSPF